MASALSNRQNCTCARTTLRTQRGRTHGAGCMRQWFRTAEPLGERSYENWNTHTHTSSLINLISKDSNTAFYLSCISMHYEKILNHKECQKSELQTLFCPNLLLVGWLVGCFWFNGPLRHYFSLYRAVSQKEGERGEKGQRRVKMSKLSPPAPTASAIGPFPTIIKIVGRPGTRSFTQHHRTTRPPPPNLLTSHMCHGVIW